MTPRKLKAALNLSASVRTVQRELQKAPYLSFGKRKHTPQLTKKHKDRRRAWARQMNRQRIDWSTVVFTDKKKFNLDGPDTFQYYWHDIRDEKEVFFSRQNDGGSLMAWGGFSALGTTELAILTGSLDSYAYQQTLTSYLLPFGDEVHGSNYVLQHDNASIHASNDTQAFLQDGNETVLPWPSLSPDLNPIENVWGQLARDAYDDGKQYESVEELKTAVLRAWSRLTPQYLNALVDSMPDRLACPKIMILLDLLLLVFNSKKLHQ